MFKDLDWAQVANYLAFAVIGLGFLALYLGWNGAANVACVDCQMPYLLSGGATGLALVITGVGVLLVQNAKRDRAQLQEELRAIAEAIERIAVAPGDARVSVGEDTTRALAPVGSVVAGASSYHAPSCHLAEGREDAEFLTPEEAEERGLTACRICKP